MKDREVRHTVYGRPEPRPASRDALDVGASRGLLTWWDLMSDLDPDWLGWAERVADEERPDEGEPQEEVA